MLHMFKKVEKTAWEVEIDDEDTKSGTGGVSSSSGRVPSQ
jgi:hypothetical protein